MDTTALSIIAGLFATGAYSLTRLLRQRDFDLVDSLLSFLAGFSIPGGCALIISALSGRQAELPSSWRENVAVAGLVLIGLAVHHFVGALRNVWPKRASLNPTVPPTSGGSTGDGLDR